MLWTLIVILVILWAIGFFAIPTLGSIVHILLVIALVVLIYQLITGHRPL